MARNLIHLHKQLFSEDKLFNIVSVVFSAVSTWGQNDSVKARSDSLPDRFYLIQEVERNGVTMPEIEIKEVTINARPGRARRSEYRQYERLISNIKKVYPYALMVRVKLTQVNEELKNIPMKG